MEVMYLEQSWSRAMYVEAERAALTAMAFVCECGDREGNKGRLPTVLAEVALRAFSYKQAICCVATHLFTTNHY